MLAGRTKSGRGAALTVCGSSWRSSQAFPPVIGKLFLRDLGRTGLDPTQSRSLLPVHQRWIPLGRSASSGERMDQTLRPPRGNLGWSVGTCLCKELLGVTLMWVVLVPPLGPPWTGGGGRHPGRVEWTRPWCGGCSPLPAGLSGSASGCPQTFILGRC